jgi:hypothetical protein
MNQRLDWRDWRRIEQSFLWPVFGLGGMLSIWMQSDGLVRFASGFVGLIPAYVSD